MPQEMIRQHVTDILAYKSLRLHDKIARLRQLEAAELSRQGGVASPEIAGGNLAIIVEALQRLDGRTAN